MGRRFRMVLVTVQFILAVSLIISTLVVSRQMNYVSTKDLGFDESHLMVISIQDSLVEKKIPAIKKELLEYPQILGAATSFNLPGEELNQTLFGIEQADGTFQQEGGQFMQIDYDFVDLMDMQIIAGRNFERSHTTDGDEAILINQAAVLKYGWGGAEEALGKKINLDTDEAGNPVNVEVVGVLNDFHVNSMHYEVTPIVLFLSEKPGGRLYVRLAEQNISETVAFLEEKWKNIDPNFPIEYLFLDTNFEQLYQQDRKLSSLFLYFSLITVFISCLGLLGLISFTVHQRTREIGIRKVLGATIPAIVRLISKEFMLLILIANVIAWPLVIYGMNRWLEGFAYRIEMSVWEFGIGASLLLLIAFATISIHALQAAHRNPAEVLKYE